MAGTRNSRGQYIRLRKDESEDPTPPVFKLASFIWAAINIMLTLLLYLPWIITLCVILSNVDLRKIIVEFLHSFFCKCQSDNGKPNSI